MNTLETLPKNNGRPQELTLTEIKGRETLASIEKIEKTEKDQITLEITEKLQEVEKAQKAQKAHVSRPRPQVRTVSVPNNIAQEDEELALPTWLRKNKNGPSFFLIDKKQKFITGQNIIIDGGRTII